VQSVLAQTFTDFELILMDDGSTDGSLEIARAISDGRVRCVADGRRLGLPARLNMICRMAHAPCLARMDADDLMHPDRLARQATFLDRHPEIDIVSAEAYIIDAGNRVVARRGWLPHRPTAHTVMGSGLFIHPAVTGRTAWFSANPYNSEYVRAEDMELWTRTWDRLRFHVMPEPLLFYREDGRATIGKYRQSKATQRRILRHYGPQLIGKAPAVVAIVESFAKELIFGTAAAAGLVDPLLRRRSCDLPADEATSAQRIVDGICATIVPLQKESAACHRF
jgi:glycosyltransferase involved in cell wall biosynthesis